ncbi:MAG: Smr/MutS family protein [Synergistaceae bacterium]|jgi:DNA mismatch repair protein MutS2|nr:Smr/MutS family protein [Synergistaceae bacterium]
MTVSDQVLSLLEFRRSLYPFAEAVRSGLGAAAIEALVPCDTAERLEERRKLLTSFADRTATLGEAWMPWDSGVSPVSELMQAAHESGVMSGLELLKVRSLLKLAARVADALAEASNRAFDPLSRRIRDFGQEVDSLSVVEDSGRLSDGASPALAEIRRTLDGLKRAGRKTAARLLEDSSVLNMLQERSLIWRDGRFLLLVRQEYVNRFPGFPIDRSASGNSIYMEPRMLAQINSRLAILTRDEQDEEHKILAALTQKILSRERAVTDAERVLGDIDLLFASCEVMRKLRWTLPELRKDACFGFVSARHPLLREHAVPIDISCGASVGAKDFRTLVITGPNTGGKTVALKTAGLCAALAWSGLPVPARDGSFVGRLDAVFADIGDEQSIEQNLSTFSAHMKNIIAILKSATPRSLVLLDELGAGTDPQEGAALGVAILEALRELGALTVASTHHNHIKQYAMTTPSVEAASMEFDAAKLTPTYRLLMGVPGKSCALLIAERLGMPEQVLAMAGAALKERGVDAEAMIAELNERGAALLRRERELGTARAEAESARRRCEDRARELELRADKIIEEADERASAIISEAESAVRAGKNGGKRRSVHDLKKAIDARHEKRTEREAAVAFEPKEGMSVRVAGSGFVGVVESLKNGHAEVTSGPMRVSVPVGRLVAAGGTARPPSPRPADVAVIMKRETVPSSLMIRGMTVDEAMPLTASYIDRAFRSGHSSVMIIHGRGEGILRREVHALCARLKYVASYRLGEIGEGGYGVTVVEFK